MHVRLSLSCQVVMEAAPQFWIWKIAMFGNLFEGFSLQEMLKKINNLTNSLEYCLLEHLLALLLQMIGIDFYKNICFEGILS